MCFQSLYLNPGLLCYRYRDCLFKTVFHTIDFKDLKDWYVSMIVTWLSVAREIVSLISYDN